MTLQAADDDQPRFAWLDMARGIGIILVVVGHALGGIIDSPIGLGRLDLRNAFLVIYIFHMPLFFMLSGALVAARIERDRVRFAQTLLIDVVWPYFLWSVIQFTIIYMVGGVTNQQVDALWPTLRDLPFTPVSQFWFLYALFVLHGLAILLYQTLGRSGFLLFCLALKPLALIVWMPVVLRLVAGQAPWYGIGVFLAASGFGAFIVDRQAVVRIVLLPVAAVLMIVVTLQAAPAFVPHAEIATAPAPALAGLGWNPLAFPAALLASLAILGIAGAKLGRIGDLLSFLGRRSMPVFILHIIGIAGTRIMLTKVLGVSDPYVILPVVVTAGLALPLIGFAVVERFGLTRALGLGRP